MTMNVINYNYYVNIRTTENTLVYFPKKKKNEMH